MKECPCGSGRAYDKCCGPIIAGAPAPTAEALMRSRYTAFTVGELDHLDRTNASDVEDEGDRAESEVMAKEVKWQRLEIIAVSGGGEADETGRVEFRAYFNRQGHDLFHHEAATFKREDGRWAYADGEINPKQKPVRVVKIERNAPCPCGSGKKYKKCCGA
jgi:SEC-C motif-containing protein